MDLNIAGLRVLITAGAGGIGLEIARTFLREGAKVHVCDIDRSALDALAKTDPQISFSQGDVANRADVARIVQEAVEHLNGLDALINNAGIAGPTGTVDEIDPEQWDRCLNVCITGQFNFARLVVPVLKQSKNPSIINVSSAGGRFGFPRRSAYAAAKWAVIGFTKSISRELGEFGIRVNAILPAVVAGDRLRTVWELKAQRLGVTFEEVESRAFSVMSIKEYVEPQQLADCIVFLCSPLARTISGQAIAIDGDLQMMI